MQSTSGQDTDLKQTQKAKYLIGTFGVASKPGDICRLLWKQGNKLHFLRQMSHPSHAPYPAQVVILVVDQQQRPDIPQDLTSLPGSSLRCPGAYVELMQHCWATDPAERPSFERVISHLRCEAALLSVSEAHIHVMQTSQ